MQMIDQKHRINRESRFNGLLKIAFEAAVFASVFTFWVIALAETYLGWVS